MKFIILYLFVPASVGEVAALLTSLGFIIASWYEGGGRDGEDELVEELTWVVR